MRGQKLNQIPIIYPSCLQIELADNFLKGSELGHICGNENLETLKLGGNKIATFDDLKCLVS